MRGIKSSQMLPSVNSRKPSTPDPYIPPNQWLRSPAVKKSKSQILRGSGLEKTTLILSDETRHRLKNQVSASSQDGWSYVRGSLSWFSIAVSIHPEKGIYKQYEVVAGITRLTILSPREGHYLPQSCYNNLGLWCGCERLKHHVLEQWWWAF